MCADVTDTSVVAASVPSAGQRDISHWCDWPDNEIIDQAACGSQSRVLLEDEIVREAIAMNVIAPFRQRLAKTSEWQPIETAPHDEFVMVAIEQGPGRPHLIHEARFYSYVKDWYYAGTNPAFDPEHTIENQAYGKPVFWQPKPEQPTS